MRKLLPFSRSAKAVLFALGCGIAAIPLSAQIYSSPPVAGGSGWMSSDGGLVRGGVVVGHEPTYRGFYVFDLSSIDAGATLESGTLTWDWISISNPLSLTAYPNDAGELLFDDNQPDLFQALGAGTIVQTASVGYFEPLTLDLSVAALAYLMEAMDSPSKHAAFGFISVNASTGPFPTLVLNWTPDLPLDEPAATGGSGASAASVAAANRQQVAHRQMQAQQAAARRVAAQQRAAQHRRNQQR